MQLTRVMAGVAMARALGTRGVEQQAVAGLSVGAFAAAVVCGALQFADALQLVRLRGALMERAYPQGYGLAAIVGLDERSVSHLVEQVSTPEAPVYLANLNAPTQFVIAGAEAGLQAALGRARTRPTRPRHAGPRRHSGRPRPERDVCGPLARRDDGAWLMSGNWWSNRDLCCRSSGSPCHLVCYGVRRRTTDPRSTTCPT
jgi:hypothetical protein